MLIEKYKIQEMNQGLLARHRSKLDALTGSVHNAASIIQKLVDFQVAIPSWALGAGGTRFGRFSIGGEPRNLEEKIEDVGLLQSLNQSSGAISLHIPWDIPDRCFNAIKAVGCTTWFHCLMQLIPTLSRINRGKEQSYKFGSLQHVDKAVRQTGHRT
jgi:L-rhamnose isomerase/sugar isomerase